MSGSALREGEVRTLAGDHTPAGGRAVDLVFRSVGERTADLALALALRHVRPRRAHVLEHVRPFALAVDRMLRLDHAGADLVVHMDADCLILEDLRPFLDAMPLPYVDSFVRDRFRGAIHCGVHVTRADVVRAMADVPVPEGDLAYVLRPESRLRNLALVERGLEKRFKHFHILHDHFQWHADVFAKYALRELRSRTPTQRRRLEAAMERWGDAPDFVVARHAIAHAARTVPADAPPKDVEMYLHNLPFIARVEVAQLALPDETPLSERDVEAAIAADPRGLGARAPRHKVFGIGLSRTGTRSLTAALHLLGWDTVHYPIDAETLATLVRGDARFPLLERFDGITDITTVPFVEDLDRAYPGSKFVLTLRDRESWLRSCEAHWAGRDAFAPGDGEEHRVHMEVRRFLRAAVYGTYELDRDRFARAYDRHVDWVRRYFADRPGDLLELDITAGDGWDALASFLGVEPPAIGFPHKGRALSARLAAELENVEVDD